MLKSLQSQFEASAERIANFQAPESLFQKFHLLTLDYRTPIFVSIIYILVVNYFSKLNREKGKDQPGKRTSTRGKKEATRVEESRFTPFKCVVIAHNLLLCLYSATTFISVLPILLQPYFKLPLLEAYCDVNKETFNAGVHFWVWNFYVSKYYELADTAILLIKGKPSSFLQTFHHSGSIMGMWLMTTTHAPAAWIFVLFNSFIHSIMYFYYTLTCLGYRPAWKRLLTSMQIVQFLIGNPLGLIYAFLPGCLPVEIIPPENVIGQILGSQLRSLYACLFVNTFFVSSLVILFTDFSRKTYGTVVDNKNIKKSEKIEKKKKPTKEKEIKSSTKSKVKETPLEPKTAPIKTTKKSKKAAKEKEVVIEIAEVSKRRTRSRSRK